MAATLVASNFLLYVVENGCGKKCVLPKRELRVLPKLEQQSGSKCLNRKIAPKSGPQIQSHYTIGVGHSGTPNSAAQE